MENPYQPPESSLTSKSNLSQFYQRGRYVVMDSRSGWPARCFKCNKDTQETKKVVLTYTTPYGFLGLVALVGFLVIVISAIFGRLAFAAKYKNDKLWVSGADKAFRNSLPEFVK